MHSNFAFGGSPLKYAVETRNPRFLMGIISLSIERAPPQKFLTYKFPLSTLYMLLYYFVVFIAESYLLSHEFVYWNFKIKGLQMTVNSEVLENPGIYLGLWSYGTWHHGVVSCTWNTFVSILISVASVNSQIS